MALLQRLYDPLQGSILLDGFPISDYDVHYLRRNIGIVSQDNILFATSIKENITYGMGQGHLPTPTDEEIWAGACGYNRPCAHQYVGKYQSCMV